MTRPNVLAWLLVAACVAGAIWLAVLDDQRDSRGRESEPQWTPQTVAPPVVYEEEE